MCYVRIIGISWGRKKIKACPQTGTWYLWGVLFKISNEHPHPFYKGVPPWLLNSLTCLSDFMKPVQVKLDTIQH